MKTLPSVSQITLLLGPVGAGKSTYGQKLVNEVGAIVFSNDEWMVNLFKADTPWLVTVGWLLTRIDRCENQMWKFIPALLKKDIHIVLDLGCLTRKRRTQVIQRCIAETGIQPDVIYITADGKTRAERVVKRNDGTSPTFTVKVSKLRFLWAERRFEAPDSEEIPGLRTVQNGSAPGLPEMAQIPGAAHAQAKV